MTLIERYFPFAGRLLLSIVFLVGGVGKFLDWSGSVAYAESKGIFAAAILVALGALVEIGGAATLITGLYARVGALLLAGFVAVASVMFHNFWAFSGLEAELELTHFLKNVAIIGGLLYVVVTGPGSMSLGSGKYRRV